MTAGIHIKHKNLIITAHATQRGHRRLDELMFQVFYAHDKGFPPSFVGECAIYMSESDRGWDFAWSNTFPPNPLATGHQYRGDIRNLVTPHLSKKRFYLLLRRIYFGH